MFLIVAVVIVSSIVILKFGMASPAAAKEAESMKSRFENDMFENVVGELNATMDNSYNTPENITTNVQDFAGFADSKMAGRSTVFKFLYVGATANKTLNALNVSVVNMLDSVVNASLALAAQTRSNSSVANNGRWDTSFNITPGSSYLLNLTYNTEGGSATTETIQITTKKNKDTYTGFFYVTLGGAGTTHVSKCQKSMNLK
jgi:hypothetical protein